ncbi:MAG: hypothetical protein WAL84_01355 [Candidatus Dormiibacterota bacterium]
MIGRALLIVLAGASTFSILSGSADVLAAAPDTPVHRAAAGQPARGDEQRDRDHRCHHGRSRDACNDENGRDRRRAPTPKAGTSPPLVLPAALPEPVSTPVPRSAPAHAAITARQGNASSLRTPSFAVAPPRGRESPAGPRPPVLAPPSLTIPAVRPVIATAGGPGAGYVIALSTILVVTTIAVLSLVLVRRSG